MDYDALECAVRTHHLTVAGAFHPDDDTGETGGTLALLAPHEPGFWAHFSASPEYRDGAPDPMDRWSVRIIGALAESLDATALFPFDGPPWQPFIAFATRTGRIHKSPVSLLVHDSQGLMVSFRGALALPHRIELPPPPLSPCLLCPAPCEDACPVDALGEDGYDTAACHAFLDTVPGADCMENGCKARRTCPVSQTFPRDPAQSAFHMRSFHP